MRCSSGRKNSSGIVPRQLFAVGVQLDKFAGGFDVVIGQGWIGCPVEQPAQHERRGLDGGLLDASLNVNI